MSKSAIAVPSFLAGIIASLSTLTLFLKPGFLDLWNVLLGFLDLWNVLLTVSFVGLLFALAAYSKALALKIYGPEEAEEPQNDELRPWHERVEEDPQRFREWEARLEAGYGHDAVQGATGAIGPVAPVGGPTETEGPREECICPARDWVHVQCPVHGQRASAGPGHPIPCTCPHNQDGVRLVADRACLIHGHLYGAGDDMPLAELHRRTEEALRGYEALKKEPEPEPNKDLWDHLKDGGWSQSK